MKIQVINGPNLNMLGKREPKLYGKLTLTEINRVLMEEGKKNNVELLFFQSNHEGAIVDCIHDCNEYADAIIINPAAYTHYSIAIRDAIASISVPVVEVHLTKIDEREEFRKISVTKDVCKAQFYGKGIGSYLEAISYFIKQQNTLKKKENTDDKK
ncbi:type II 3-dehydroquinate dehydratase [Sinanaerobacter sp. ZZT-01]|uniref:type II 3-dehydroquinate dehydratase n=1 Tax=Sinanaerobacter sp. ZZT-01 TaxID=3111540 RepID=UPI002D77DB00|nr:type II 3-dehydroquinate dehydratase [Sinanaerobacter sp. ZZT-01]WRR94752.1 type II 3-dehydroquinate dehydratase [Sinanaerobacter sp. ZZT-01]